MFFAKRPTVTTSQAAAPASLEEKPTSPMPMLTSGPGTSQLPVPLGARTITSALSAPGNTTNRVPIVIKGEMKRPEPPAPPNRSARQKHSKRLWILGMSIVILTISATLLGLTTQGQGLIAKRSNLQTNGNGTVTNQQGNNGLAPAALATTTWMYENDGYDPFSHGEVNISDGKYSWPWPYGQCTYWANWRYHQLTGYWVQWTGNADQWFLGAQKAGWDYGQTPPPGVPSIIVLMPYVQLAGGVGHVAVVEGVSGNVVHTSNMNWGYGGWTHTEYVDFTLGPGVYFVWHKPAE